MQGRPWACHPFSLILGFLVYTVRTGTEWWLRFLSTVKDYNSGKTGIVFCFLGIRTNEMEQTVLYFSIKTTESKFSRLTPFTLKHAHCTSFGRGIRNQKMARQSAAQVSGLRREPRSCLLGQCLEHGVWMHSYHSQAERGAVLEGPSGSSDSAEVVAMALVNPGSF